jgi:hypothetical protein
VKRSLREVLADSHVAAVANALLLLWSLDGGFRALGGATYTLRQAPHFNMHSLNWLSRFHFC